MLLAGRYELREVLGQGAYATVYRARDRAGQGEVALKLLHRLEPRALARFAREADTLSRLRHPALVSVLATGQADDGRPFIVQELVPGTPLLARCRPEALLPPREAARVLRDAARGVQHAHEQGVVHRDLKPGNVLVEPGGRGRVVDFGIAHLLHGTGPALTLDGTPLGSPGYMSPEQARGEPPGPASDVYGLGATLYHALCGAPPFHEQGNALQATLEAAPTPPGRWRAGVPAELDALVLRCLAKRPEERPGSAGAVAAALDDWLGRSAPPRQARLGRGALLAAALLLLAAGTSLGVLLARRPGPAASPAAEPGPGSQPAATPVPGLAAELTALVTREPPPELRLVQPLLEQADQVGSAGLARARLEAAAALQERARLLASRGGAHRPDVAARLGLAVALSACDPEARGRAQLLELDYALRRGRFAEAEALARTATATLVAGRIGLELRFMLAASLSGDERREEGRALLRALAADDPQGVVGLVAAGRLEANDWRYEQSNALAERALALEPDYRPALRLLALGLAFRNQEPRALELLERSRALVPDDAQVELTAAYACANMGETEAGARAATLALELVAPLPYPRALKARGIARLRGGLPDRAIEDLDAALALRERDADLLIYRGAAHLAAGHRERARDDWEAAWREDPSLVRRRVGDLPPPLRPGLLRFLQGR